jgi:ribosomal protein L22
MTPDAKDPKDEAEVTEETQDTTEATAEEPTPKPKPKRARSKKAKPAKAAATAEAEAPEAEAEEAPEAEAEEAPEAEAEEAPAAEEKPAKPKRTRTKKAETKAEEPARKRDRRRQPEPGVLVRAQAKYVRTSARKARLVCDHIRGKDVTEARAILAYTPRAAAKPWLKLLESAIANAEHNHELVGDDLKIAAVHADEGPTLKRYRPRAMGRATRIRKRTSHLTITLTPKES